MKDLDPVAPKKARFEFEQMDRNSNGTLEQSEVLAAMSQLFPNADHTTALQYAYQAADSDHDGKISPTEFLALTQHLVFLNNLWKLFDATDSDGSRRIDLEEFIVGCKLLDLDIDEQTAEDEFNAILDASGIATFDAFSIWCSKRNAEHAATTFTAASTIQANVRGRQARRSRPQRTQPVTTDRKKRRKSGLQGCCGTKPSKASVV